jgi:L-seryl-tRNA(Ser) seleniumtransferase
MVEPILDAMLEAARSYVNIYELQDRVGKRIASMTHNEAAFVSCGAASGLLLAVAGCMTGLDDEKRKILPNTRDMKNQVIMHRKGRFPEDFAVQQTGATIVEIGGENDRQVADELASAITDRTAAILIMTFGGKSEIPIPLAVDIGRARGVPVIVDAAYGVPPKENLWYFTKELSVDAAIFSGGKGLLGPASTGLVLGRRKVIEGCIFNSYPDCFIGRPMKVGKEEMVGVYAAVKHLLERDEMAITERYVQQMGYIISHLGSIPHVTLTPETHGPWADNFGVLVSVDGAATGLNEGDLYRACVERPPYIEVGPRGVGVYINVSTLKIGEERIVVSRLLEVFQTAKKPVVSQ